MANISTSSIRFPTEDGEAMGFLAWSEDIAALPGLIVLQEFWGLNDHIKDVTQRVEASYELRTSAEALESDLSYRRHLGSLRYRYSQRHNTVLANVAFGGITGDAPLFERFTLGDSATLRGWNKFELAPIGGNRVFHQSLEYRFHGAALFLDTGSVWDDGASHKLRASTGFGFHTEHVFLTVAFPLNAPGTDAAFMMGVRF